MKITLDQKEFEELKRQFHADSGTNLIATIRSKLPDTVNKKIRFTYSKTPFHMEIQLDPGVSVNVIQTLSPSSKTITKVKSQVSKLSMSKAVKQLGLVMALKDLQKEFLRCF